MGVKGKLKPDHIPQNKYELLVVGIPIPLTFVTVGAIEEELDMVDLPDRTRASGGETKPVEFSGTLPMHHLAEQAAMELWYTEGKAPVSATYKKVGSLVLQSISGALIRSYSLDGLCVTKRGLPEFGMENEGEAAMVEWSFSADRVNPL